MYVVAGVVLVMGYILAFVILPLAVKIFLTVTTPAPRQSDKIKAGAVLSPPRKDKREDNCINKPEKRESGGVDIWI